MTIWASCPFCRKVFEAGPHHATLRIDGNVRIACEECWKPKPVKPAEVQPNGKPADVRS